MNFAEHGFIDHIEFQYPDLHLIHLKDGRVVGINKECIVLYESEDAFHECATNELPTIQL
jgi:hypothetical protein